MVSLKAMLPEAALDRFEADTAELPAVTEDELCCARRTVDHAYVAYLERQVSEATKAAESARAAALAAGSNNAELARRLESLEAQLRRLEERNQRLAERLEKLGEKEILGQ
jgi:hypothetical protein